MTDLLDSDNIGMHFLINLIYLRTYICAEFELLYPPDLCPCLSDLRFILNVQSQIQQLSRYLTGNQNQLNCSEFSVIL